MRDALDGERRVKTLIDQVERLARRVARREEQLRVGEAGTEQLVVRTTSTGTRWLLFMEDLGDDWPALVMAEL